MDDDADWSEVDAWLSSEADWSELDAWLDGEGTHTAQAPTPVGPPQRRRRRCTSAGHVHEEFEHHNTKMHTWSAVGASPRLVENLEHLGTRYGALSDITWYESLLIARVHPMIPVAALTFTGLLCYARHVRNYY